MGAGYTSHGFIQEGNERPPTPPYARRDLQDRLVHGAPHPRSHEGRCIVVRSSWRRRQDRGGRRTYIGKRDVPYVSPQRKGRPFTKKGKGGSAQKRTVVSLAERGGQVRSFHVQHATKAIVRDILVRNADRSSTLYTDESRLYTTTGEEYSKHETVNHSRKEYARGEVHTNTIENVFSVFKRGMIGVYQHCGEAHLHRYLAEFDFRYNRRTALKVSDAERAEDLLRMVRDKRMTYRRIGEAGIA